MSWQVWKQNDQDYLISCLFSSDMVTVKITNMIQFWNKSMQNKNMIELFQDQNPLVEAEEGEGTGSLVKHIQNVLDLNKSKIEVKEENGKLFIQFSSRFHGIPVGLGLHLELREPSILYNEVMVPLLLTVQNLLVQQKYLLEELKKKDVELDDYKLEGFKLTRKNIETAKFNENMFSAMPLPVKEIDPSQMLNVISQCKIFDELCNLTKPRRNTASVPEIASSKSDDNSDSLPQECVIGKRASSDEVINVCSETKNSLPQKTIDASKDVKKRKLDI